MEFIYGRQALAESCKHPTVSFLSVQHCCGRIFPKQSNLLISFVCESIGVLICASYILYNIKLFSLFIPSVSGISTIISSETPFKSPVSLYLLSGTINTFFGILPFIILFFIMMTAFIVRNYRGGEQYNLSPNILFSSGFAICSLVVLTSISVGIFFPIVDTRNLLVLLPTFIIILSILMHPLLDNIKSFMFGFLLFFVFSYATVQDDLQFLNMQYREGVNYYLLDDKFSDQPVVYTSYPKIIKAYIDLRYMPSQIEVNDMSNILNNSIAKNIDNILLVDTFIPFSKLNQIGTVLKNKHYQCYARNNIQNIVSNNVNYAAFIIISCHKTKL